MVCICGCLGFWGLRAENQMGPWCVSWDRMHEIHLRLFIIIIIRHTTSGRPPNTHQASASDVVAYHSTTYNNDCIHCTLLAHHQAALRAGVCERRVGSASLHVAADNAPARTLYTASGFQVGPVGGWVRVGAARHCWWGLGGLRFSWFSTTMGFQTRGQGCAMLCVSCALQQSRCVCSGTDVINTHIRPHVLA